MGESPDQNDINTLLADVLRELARERGWIGLRIAADSFFQWVPGHLKVQVSPDVYIMENPPEQTEPEERRRCFKTWLPGIHPPRLAVEVVSRDKKKDFTDAPARYSSLGCRELIVFDPAVTPRSKRQVFTVFGRDDDGLFVRRSAGPGPVYSSVIDAWFVAVKRPDGMRLMRVARDAAGRDLVPSSSERADAEAQRAAAEAQRADAAARALHQAQRRIAELEAKLKATPKRE